jgi:hypothetical protein
LSFLAEVDEPTDRVMELCAGLCGVLMWLIWPLREIGVTPHPSVPAGWAVHGQLVTRVWLRLIKSCDRSMTLPAHQAGALMLRHL